MEDEVLSWNLEPSAVASAHGVTPTSGIHLVNTASVMTSRMDDVDTRINILEQECFDLKEKVNELEYEKLDLERKLEQKTELYESQLFGFIRLTIAVLKEIDTTKFNRTLGTMEELLNNFDYSNSREYYLDPNGEEVDEDIIE